MENLYILYAILLGTVTFVIGYFYGKGRGHKQEEIRREMRAKRVIEAMFADLKAQEPGHIDLDQYIGAPNSYDRQLLEHTLKQALQEEDYERAAQIRDLLDNEEES